MTFFKIKKYTMKKTFLTAMILSMAFGVLYAQDEKPFHKGKKPMQKGMHSMMAEKLNLTGEQKDKMKSLNEDFRNQMTELRKNENITVKEMNNRKETLRKNHKEKVQSLLTNDQKAQLEKMKQERKAKHEAGTKARFEKMKTNLGLTDAQAAKIDKNRTASMDKMKSIRENQALSSEQKKEQFMELRKQQKEQMKSILTEEQLKKMQEMRKRGARKSGKIT
jgi:Spy/CpxP family protein refolding chaperone